MAAPYEVEGKGTEDDPWILRTPPGKSEYSMYRDESADPPQLVCVVECRVRSAEIAGRARSRMSNETS